MTYVFKLIFPHPFPLSRKSLSGSSPVEVLPQVEILPQDFLVFPQLTACRESHSANKLISPCLEIMELFHSVLLQRKLEQICLRGFQGTVHRVIYGNSQVHLQIEQEQERPVRSREEKQTVMVKIVGCSCCVPALN